MRSLAAKLTLAFLFIGIVGAGLVVLLTARQTRTQFEDFVDRQNVSFLVESLNQYYVENEDWHDVDNLIENNTVLANHPFRLVVVNKENRVVYDDRSERLGRRVVYNENALNHLVIGDGDPFIGFIDIGRPRPTGGNPNSRRPNASSFLDRIERTFAISAAVAAASALLLGSLLARNLMKPVRALTEATDRMAQGKLGEQVPVTSKDEIGQLTRSFNLMSQDLAQASQSRKQLTADIAHDLRTPLTVLRGYTEGLKEGTVEGDEALYTTMFEEVTLLQRLVDDLRTLSLADAGELTLNKRSVDPKALLERTALAYMMQAQQMGLTLQVESADNLPSVSVDMERISQVLNNLVANALNHTNEGGIVLHATATADGMIQLRVQDSGVGIEPDALPRLFERFYRGDAARDRTADNSSGLGLAIAKAIIVAHNGDISVESTLGSGSTFSVLLPL